MLFTIKKWAQLNFIYSVHSVFNNKHKMFNLPVKIAVKFNAGT